MTQIAKIKNPLKALGHDGDSLLWIERISENQPTFDSAAWQSFSKNLPSPHPVRQSRLASTSSKSRRSEWTGARALALRAKKELGDDFSFYDLSISHCQDFVGVLLAANASPFSVGVDIEKLDRPLTDNLKTVLVKKASTLQHRAEIHPIEIWCAFEAVFKAEKRTSGFPTQYEIASLAPTPQTKKSTFQFSIEQSSARAITAHTDHGLVYAYSVIFEV